MISFYNQWCWVSWFSLDNVFCFLTDSAHQWCALMRSSLSFNIDSWGFILWDSLDPSIFSHIHSKVLKLQALVSSDLVHAWTHQLPVIGGFPDKTNIWRYEGLTEAWIFEYLIIVLWIKEKVYCKASYLDWVVVLCPKIIFKNKIVQLSYSVHQ